MQKYSAPLTVRLTPEMRNTLDQFAKDRQKTQSKVIKEFIELITPADKPQPKLANNVRSSD